jgi:hypothetical protein
MAFLMPKKHPAMHEWADFGYIVGFSDLFILQ